MKHTLVTFIPLAEKVVDQTKRRILNDEKVPAQEKVVSIFEPHTDIICRGKESHPVEYGHKVWLNEVDGGIVTHFRILDGNPNDETQWEPSLNAHVESFGKPPEQASADRGLYSAPNEKFAKDLGIQHVVLPKRGYKSKQRREHEGQEWFVQGRKWHAGVEGRISVLKKFKADAYKFFGWDEKGIPTEASLKAYGLDFPIDDLNAARKKYNL